jgi:Rrf2 family protein
MKLFSRASEYAILTLMHVVEHDSLQGFSPKEVCASAGIPEAFARKSLLALAKARILSGTPGPGGGYRLLHKPSDVSLLDIVLAVDGENAFDECPLGVRCDESSKHGTPLICATCMLMEPNCGLNHLCPMHNLWREAKELVVSRLKTTTLDDIRTRLTTQSSPKPHRETKAN